VSVNAHFGLWKSCVRIHKRWGRWDWAPGYGRAMRRHSTTTVVAGVVTVLLVSASALPALAQAPTSQAGDQARLDAAIDGFEQRLTDAGWVGEPADDDEDEDDADAGGDAIGDDEFNECFGELAAVLEDVDGEEFPGQTAMRESLEFTFVPAGAVPETTEEFSFELGDEETVAAFAVSVDDTGTQLLDSLVDTMGAKETGDCVREAMEAEMAPSSSDEEIPAEFEFAVANEADLGVGERSARLQLGFDMDFMGMSMVFDFSMYLARVDRDLVMLMHGTFGTPAKMSGFDPLAELQTLVDAL
jgi:hypothetical protein